jgi:Holliday junction resolvase RusA-like endonuclease
MRLEIFVRGLPAPQGSKRPVLTRAGKLAVVESSKKVKPWREAIVAQVGDAWKVGPIDGAVFVARTYYMPRPKSHYRRDGSLKECVPTYCTTRPDIDKLDRSTFDGLKSAGVYRDDNQVVVGNHEKRYVDDEHQTPGAYLQIEPVYWEATA